MKSRQVFDAPVKVLKIYNPLQDQDQDLFAFSFDHLALSPNENFIFDLPANSTRRSKTDTIQDEPHYKEMGVCFSCSGKFQSLNSSVNTWKFDPCMRTG